MTKSSAQSDDAESYVTSDDEILAGSIRNEGLNDGTPTLRFASKRTLKVKNDQSNLMQG